MNILQNPIKISFLVSLFFKGFEDMNMDEDSQETIDEDSFNLVRFNYVPLPAPEEGFRRVARGVHEECCMRPCGQKTLKLYCKFP